VCSKLRARGHSRPPPRNRIRALGGAVTCRGLNAPNRSICARLPATGVIGAMLDRLWKGTGEEDCPAHLVFAVDAHEPHRLWPPGAMKPSTPGNLSQTVPAASPMLQ